jgi:pimeloyl-ACP methyl ester carboxylesterase
MDIDGAFQGMRFLTVAGVWLAGHLPWLLESGAWLFGGFVRGHPRFIYERFNQDVPPADQRWILSPSFAGGAIADLREALRHGPDGYVADLEVLARPWGFAVDDITVPVHLWHGADDRVIPIQHGEYLASHIPHASFHLCEGEGHLVLWNHLEAVFSDATDGLRRTGLPALSRSA